ncbi:FxLYD domain-containing protein [Halobacillus faecis]
MKKLLLVAFLLILVACSESSNSETLDENDTQQGIRQEVRDESIDIANSVNYFVENKIVVPSAINRDLLEKWFPDMEFTDEEYELYQYIIDLVLIGGGVVRSDFDEYNVNLYNENLEVVKGILGEENISDENLDMEYVRLMQNVESEYEDIQKDSMPSLSLEDTNCRTENGYIKTTGYIKNNDSKSFSYVRVQVTYLDNNKNVIDTDWTYAVDSQPLKPNDRTSYEISSPKNSEVKNCTHSITEYQ